MQLGLKKKLALEAYRLYRHSEIKTHKLTYLFWECTLRCDLKCRHCGSDCKTVAGHEDMPLEDFIRVLDSIAAKTDSRQVFIIITGGEPLVREDIVECCRAIRDHGFPWGMVTNGLYLTPELLHQLVDAGMHAMTISLDGLEENHNWMRGNENSFKMVSQSIDMLVATKGFVFDIVTCVNRRNYGNCRRFLICL